VSRLIVAGGVSAGVLLGLLLSGPWPPPGGGTRDADPRAPIVGEDPSDAWRRASLPEVPATDGTRPAAMGFCQGRSGDNCVIDGDSFILNGVTIRLAAIDAPEIGSPRCAAERALGERAKARLRVLLSGGAIELVANADRDRDRHGRLLRDARVNGASVSARLVEEGLARPWQGRKQGWC
jgi:endonuclease YncB( thermonuclease family)